MFPHTKPVIFVLVKKSLHQTSNSFTRIADAL